MNRFLLRSAAALVINIPCLFGGPQGQTEYREIKLSNGARLRYALVTPAGYFVHPDQPIPVLLAMPQAKQDEEMVELGLNTYWEREAKERGWVVVSPTTPDGRFYSDGAEEHIPALLDEVAKQVKVEGGKFHLAGAGNGGISAFQIAMRFPERFQTLTVLPGYIQTVADLDKAATLRDLKVRIYIGEKDQPWLALAQRSFDALRKAGVDASFDVLPGEGHMIKLAPARLFSPLDADRLAAGKGQVSATGQASPVSLVEAVLDDFHDAASKADETRYFSHLTDNAVFLGTDPGERWTKSEFRGWANAHGYLKDGVGWTYRPRKRNVILSPDGTTAWFDESLNNEGLGTCRGTGVLVRIGHADKPVWKIAQYNLSIPIPNELSQEFVGKIRAGGKN